MLGSERVPCRLVLGLMVFWGALSAFMLRVNLSLSIVAMVGVRRPQGSSANSTVAFNTSGCVRETPDNLTLTYDQSEEGEFAWSETTQGTILSAFFWGYLVLQLPGGRLAEMVGGRRVFGTAMMLASLLAVLTPTLARVHHFCLVAVRVGQGLCLGVHFPTVSAMVARWVPVTERARFVGTFTMGGMLGLAVMMPVCGLIIANLGWPALFYISGAHGLLFSVCWFLLVHDGPELHPRISLKEKRHIERGLMGGPIVKLPIPWRSLLTSMQVWAPFLTAVGSDWGFYTLLTLGPKYMASILGVNMKQNGLLSALPFLCRYINGALMGQLFDLAFRRHWLRLINVRRCAACISHLLPAALLIAFPLVGCDLTGAVVLLCLAMAGNGAISSGHIQSQYDIAPNFVGTLAGLRNGLCSLTGIISPIIIGAILEHDASVTGWRMAFALSAGIYASSSVLFLLFFTAEVQPWNGGTVLTAKRTTEETELKEPMTGEHNK